MMSNKIDNGAVYIMSPGTETFVKTADLARMTGKSTQWINQLVASGFLHRVQTPHGAMFHVQEAVREYIDYMDQRNITSVDPTSASIAASEAIIKKSKAEIAHLDAKERLARMHAAEDVEAMTNDLIYTIIEAIAGIPGQLATILSDNKYTEVPEIYAVIQQTVCQSLERMAGYTYDDETYKKRIKKGCYNDGKFFTHIFG